MTPAMNWIRSSAGGGKVADLVFSYSIPRSAAPESSSITVVANPGEIVQAPNISTTQRSVCLDDGERGDAQDLAE